MSKKKNTMFAVFFVALLVMGLFWIIQFGGSGFKIGMPVKQDKELTNKATQYGPTQVVSPYRIKNPDTQQPKERKF